MGGPSLNLDFGEKIKIFVLTTMLGKSPGRNFLHCFHISVSNSVAKNNFIENTIHCLECFHVAQMFDAFK